MDPRLCSAQFGNQSAWIYPDARPGYGNMFSDGKQVGRPGFEGSMVNHSFQNGQLLPSDTLLRSTTIPNTKVDPEDDCNEDCDFSDAILRYISQILMEEDLDDKPCMFQDSLDLLAKEKSFYDVLGKKYPPSPEPNSIYVEENDGRQLGFYSGNRNDFISGCSTSSYFTDPNEIYNFTSHISQTQCISAYSFSNSLLSSSQSSNNILDVFLDSPVSPLQLSDLLSESQSIWKFQKGVEEARKFLPDDNELFLNIDLLGSSLHETSEQGNGDKTKVNRKDQGEFSPSGLRVRKNFHSDDDYTEERSTKQAAVFQDSIVPTEEFDSVLLCQRGKVVATVKPSAETGQNGTSNSTQHKASAVRKGNGRKKNRKKEVIDLRTLLISCAQAVAADDHKNAYELLKQIRQHSTPYGDGNQRLACCFADGLEARLAGTGSQIYKALVCKRTTAADYLKAYQLYLKSCPFTKISNFASNRTIRIKSQHATRVHVIDFGILYGFQWPTFIERFSGREGGPPKLRITGIDYPQPGFRPAQHIEETGRRLADYAQRFNVPFEYNAIASKWEKINIGDLKLDRDDFIVVNCSYRCKNLLDETLMVDSPRNSLLNLIRKINPDMFIQGIVNGAYSAPFYVTRFREALFHFSSMFDMLEANVTHEHCERIVIEREIFGREAMNVIACEGWERIERPETYKQWQVRNLRAGFTQMPFDRDIVQMAKEKVRKAYHKDFVIDEDAQWLVQGWKGRIIYALSCWKPA